MFSALPFCALLEQIFLLLMWTSQFTDSADDLTFRERAALGEGFPRGLGGPTQRCGERGGAQLPKQPPAAMTPTLPWGRKEAGSSPLLLSHLLLHASTLPCSFSAHCLHPLCSSLLCSLPLKSESLVALNSECLWIPEPVNLNAWKSKADWSELWIDSTLNAWLPEPEYKVWMSRTVRLTVFMLVCYLLFVV